MTIESSDTRFRLTFSFFAVITAMLLTCDRRIVIISALSSLLHECGHLALLFVFGEKPECVVFGAFGIRIERQGVSSLSYKRQAAVAMGGISVNLALAVVFAVLYGCFSSEVLAVGFAVNIFIGGLNMIPVGILDAGQFLRYILLERFEEDETESRLNIVSDFSVLLFACFCVFYTVFFGLNASLICVCLYLMAVNIKLRISSHQNPEK